MEINLTTITGIVAATMLIVELLKRIFENSMYFNRIPIFVYAAVVSAILAIFANKIIYIDGQPLISGNLWIVIWQAVINAATASGLYSWIKKPETPATAGRLL